MTGRRVPDPRSFIGHRARRNHAPVCDREISTGDHETPEKITCKLLDAMNFYPNITVVRDKTMQVASSLTRTRSGTHHMTQHAARTSRFRLVLQPICIISACALASCDDAKEVRVYRAPKDTMTSVNARNQPASARNAPRNGALQPPSLQTEPMRAATNAGMSDELTWVLSEGWSEVAESSPMRLATLRTNRNGATNDVTVTKLAGRAGSLLANVNRWRNQLGLPPIDDAALAETVHPLERGAMPATVVDIEAPETADAPPQRMIACFFEHAGASWFFKITGDKRDVDALESEFMGICRSVHPKPRPAAQGSEPFNGTDMSAPNAELPPALTAPQSAGPLTFRVPPGWTQDPEPRVARVATILIDETPGAEMAISRFAGDVGGELANVNRWRRQLGLPPAATLADESVTNVNIAGHPARLYRFAASSASPDAQGMIVALMPHTNETWFFKLTGRVTDIDANRENLEAFLQSVSFTP